MPLAVNFAIQFCEGMKHAVRTAGIVHRDIKPANVLIKGDRILKIADFGLAKALGPAAEDMKADTCQGSDGYLSLAGGGTPPYMPAEQFESLSRADTRSDIFSFGAMFHELLTSRRLFAAKNASEHFALRKMPIPVAHEVNPRVPPALSAIIARCVAYERSQRYQSFDDLAADLLRVHETLPDRLPIPRDPHKLPSEFFSPSTQILGETYSLISLGQYAEAAQRAQEGIDVCPDNAGHWLNKGKALGELKDFAAARKCFTKATQLRPVDAQAWANLGWSTLALGDAATALTEATRATKLDHEFADGWVCRGCCERTLARMDRAVHSLNRAIELAPHNWKAHANLGFCLAELGPNASALAALRRASEINPDDTVVWYKIAWLMASEGQMNHARNAIDKCLKLDEADADAWGLRALILWQGDGDTVAANACLERALELDPQNEKARTMLEALAQRAAHSSASRVVSC